MSATPTVKGEGSSPLTRGKRAGSPGLSDEIRLIPAHAGKTVPAQAVVEALPAHPRSRGENPQDRTSMDKLTGSSPLTRGKHRGVRVRPGGERLIPAHAGKTRTLGSRRRPGQAHPRSRGENYPARLSLRWAIGSSPLTRGKPTHAACQGVGDRLIPAHAGKTASLTRRSLPIAAHPRSRGENRGCSLPE